jgi:hypothetical protein
MRRVKGVRRNAIILFAGVLAGLLVFYHFLSSPLIADAAADLNAVSLVVSDRPSSYEKVNDSLIKTQPDVPLKKAAVLENPSSANASEVLTSGQLLRLQEASLDYLALTPADGSQIARSLNIVKDGGDPTNICGPLSIAILSDAGILDPYIKIRDFWLLNPTTDRRLLDQTFPSERFDHFQFSTPVNEMDWKSFPLTPGDFLYLYAGSKGTFEHMLVVTRVDEFGRAYSVTNHATPEGFVIDEVMLYDPSDPGLGKFSEWANRQNNKIGTTGFGGFELWRLTQPIRERSPLEESFAHELDTVMDSHGGDWYVAVVKLNGETLYMRQAAVPVDVGSMIKLPVAMLFFKSLELEGIAPSDYGEFLVEEGPGLTYEQLLRALFEKSDLSAAKVLLSETRLAGLNVERVLEQWGLKNANLELRKLSAQDMVTLYEGLYSGRLVDPYAREYLLNLMGEIASNNDTRLGILQRSNPSSLDFYNHRGSPLDTIVAMGDSAIVSVPVVDGEDTYIVVLYGFFDDFVPTTDQALILAIEEMAQVLWSFARK